MNAFNVEHVTFSYYGRAPSRKAHEREKAHTYCVFNDLTFEIEQGETFGIIGLNGSGKTSLLKLLANVLLPQEGNIRLYGRSLTDMAQSEVARIVALVPQES